jgi:murein tripeptide amidase MpaA
VSFWVRRFDQSPETRQTFATVEQASKHPDDVEKLQVYCLALVGNLRIEVVTESDNDGKVMWITDTETGHVFGVRTFDLEAETRLCIHAETPPTIGNWEPASDS